MMDEAKKDEEREDSNLTVVVNGEPVTVHANENQQISVIIKHALRKAEQSRAPEGWELRAGEGDEATVLEASKKLRDYGIALPATLFLNLIAGGGGGA
jgi:hypothetical protein